MYSNPRGRMLGLLYLLPALAFVLVFTAYPVVQMMWMSLHNWSIIEPARWVGLANFVKAWNDRQFWTSLGFTLKYTAYITPILMILGYLIALLTAANTPLRAFTGQQAEVRLDGQNVGELLQNLVARHGELRQHLFTPDGKLRSFVNVYVNDNDIRYLEKERTPIGEAGGSDVALRWPAAWRDDRTVVEQFRLALAFPPGTREATMTRVLLYPVARASP